MASVTWLHLSDWHQKGKDFDRTVVRDKLIEDIRNRASIDPRLANISFIVFSGDLAHGGKAEEYQAARENLLDPIIEATGLNPKQHLLIVPGNHDLERDALDLAPAPLLQTLSSNEHVQKWLANDKYRDRALDPFSNFRAFVADYTGQPFSDYANVLRIKVGTHSVALLGLNSSWMCGRNKDDEGNVDDRGFVVVGEPQIHDALGDIAEADIRIIVQHHPWDWLAEFERQRIRDRLQQSAHFVLMGHQHMGEVQETHGTSGNCVLIPAGASYDRRQSADPTYANAYNWVHLDLESGRGTVFLRRWSERRTSWIADNDASTDGRYGFDLPNDMSSTPASISPEASARRKARRQDQAEKHYRRLMLETCDIVSLANLPEQDRHVVQRQLQLRRLYVPLRVHLEKKPVREDHPGCLETSDEPRFLAGPRRDDKAPVSVGECLAKARKVVVLGDPGAGKTTLTRWIATAYLLRLTRDPAWSEVPDVKTLPDQDLLPIVIRCRDLGASVEGSLDDILGHTLRKAELSDEESTTLKALLRDHLKAGSALLIFDGLDEINDPRARAKLCRQIERMAIAYPQAFMIATSRIVGYREMGYRLERGFEHLRLAELEDAEKDDFARRWCELVELPERKTKAAEELIHDIHCNPRIEQMTGNPMLLTTMALVKRKVGRLPNRRADLYGEAVQVLLNWRSDVDLPLDQHEAVPQLEYLAYAMCDRGVQRLRRDEVLELLVQMREAYPNLHSVRERSPEEFLRKVEARTALLMESGRVRHLGLEEPVYEFRHLTFQEYLAARALVDRRFPGRDPQTSLAQDVSILAGRTERRDLGMLFGTEVTVVLAWREALRLSVNICQDDDVDAVLRAIIEGRESDGKDAGWARTMLGMMCLADEPNVSESVVERIVAAYVREILAPDLWSTSPRSPFAATEAVADSRWAQTVIQSLSQAFSESDANTREKLGLLPGIMANTIARRYPAGPALWLTEQLKRLNDGSELEAIGAALSMWQLHINGIESFVPGLAKALFDRLSGSAAMAHAAAGALSWLNWPVTGRGPWHPDHIQTQQLLAFIANSESDLGAVRHLLSLLANEKVAEAAQTMIELLGASSMRLRREAVTGLGELRCEAAVEHLVQLLLYDSTPVREAAADALCKIGTGAAEHLLVQLLQDPKTKVRAASTRALGLIASENARKVLSTLLSHADSDLRIEALQALTRGTAQKDAILLSRNLDRAGPFLDPLIPITEDQASRAAAKLGLPLAEIQARYEWLAEQFGLKLAWRQPATQFLQRPPEPPMP